MLRKKHLRKYADPGLKFSPGHGLLHTEVLNYIIRAAVKNIRGQRVLAVHRDLKGWIHREVLPAYVFYRYRKGKKRCGRAVTFKPFGRISNLFDRVTGQVVQRTGENELLVRIFKAQKHYRSYRDAEAHIWENARFFVRRDDSVDLSITTDLTCASLLFMKRGEDVKYITQMYFLPADNLQERVKVDKIPYDIWHRRGLLRLCVGNSINYSDVTA